MLANENAERYFKLFRCTLTNGYGFVRHGSATQGMSLSKLAACIA